MPKKTPAPSAPAATPQRPADAAVLPPSAQTVLAHLDAENPLTAAEVAESCGLGRSTVTKALSTLHDAGLAVRQDGGFDGPRRIADRWFAAPDATEAVKTNLENDDAEQPAADDAPAELVEAVIDSGGDAIGDTDSATADRGGDEPPLDTRTGGSEPDEGPADAEPGCGDETADDLAVDSTPDGETAHDGSEADEPTHTQSAEPDHTHDADAASMPETDRPESERAEEPNELAAGGSHEQGQEAVSQTAQSDPAHPGATPAAPPVMQTAGAEGSAARLGKGELRAQVEAHLRENPDQAWTPTAIAKVLNRSAGAINNACEKLLETESVTTFEDKPRRFQWRNGQGADTAAVGSTNSRAKSSDL